MTEADYEGESLKMKKITIAFILSISIFFPSTTFAANWTWFASTDTITFQIDSSNVQRISNTYFSETIYKVWEKEIYNQAGIQDKIKYREKYDFPTEGWYDLSYSISRVEIKYIKGEKYWSSSSITYYDSNGNVLESNKYVADWREIIPETIGEMLYNTAIKYAK